MVKCIYVDADSKWWIAELISGSPLGNVRIIKECPEQCKEIWKPKLLAEFIEKGEPWILYYYVNGPSCLAPFKGKVID